MAHDYFITGKISDNIGETPEGFVICTGSVLGRSGHQIYKGSELPQDTAHDLGLDLSDPSASFDVYRSPEEVFSNATLASGNGKAFVVGHPADGGLVDPSNVAELENGHVQNLRRGVEPLESGDWPMLGDIVIKREPMISRIKDGERPELSCGYEYALDREGGQLVQRNIVINHVAAVPKGRAGSSARISDHAPQVVVVVTESVVPTISEPVVVVKVEVPPTPAVQVKSRPGHGCTGDSTKKERPKMNLKTIFGLGLKQLALDEKTTPEEMAEAA